MENLKKLHSVLVRDGYTQKSFDDFVNEAATDAVYQKKIYEVVYRDQLFGGSEEEFAEKYFKELPTSPLGDVKKKDDSDFTSEEEVTVSNTQEVQAPGLSGPSAPQTETVTQEEVVDEGVDELPPPETQPEIQQIQEVPNRTGASQQEVQNYEDAIKTDKDFTGEESTDIEDFFGKNWFTDFIGDMYRAGVQGQAQGGTLDESLELFTKGKDVTDEDIQDFIIAQQEMQNAGQSDEMREFNSIYQKEGGSWWGFIKGVASNPTVIPQLFVSSVSAMVNPTVIAAAAAGGGAGAAAGSTGFSMGPLGVATTAGGAIAGAMGAAGGTLETGLTFAELLLEQLDGKPMTKENVREILESPEKMQGIRWKSAGRGFAIGMVDAISAGVASKVTAKVAGLTGKKMLATGAGIGVEAVGGSTGEVAGRLVAGQEMDVAEIGFEGVAGTATAPLTVGYGLYKAPKYYINKQSGGPGVAEVSGPEMAKFIREASPEEIAGATLEIVNDPELKAIAEEKKKQIKQDAGIIKQLKEAGITDDATITKLVELEKQRDALSGNTTRAGKKKLAEIDALIDQLMDGVDVDITTLSDDQGNTVTQTVIVTEEYARKKLQEEGVDFPTVSQIEAKQAEIMADGQSMMDMQMDQIEVTDEEVDARIQELKPNTDIATTEERQNVKEILIKEKQDAIQESSTETVDVQESTEDSQEVGEGDTPGQPTQESQEGDTDTETQTQAEVVEDIDGEPTITDQETREATSDLSDLIQRIDDNNPGQNKSRTDVDEIEDTQVENTQVEDTQVETTPEAETTTVEAVTTDTDGNLNIIESQGGTQVNLPGQQVNNNLSVTERTTEQNDNHYSSDLFIKENPNTTVEQHETKILDLANKAVNAINKILPDTKIIIHRSEDAYNQFVTGKGTRGTFDATTNTIHINMPKANAKTIAHEVFHAVLYDKYGSDIKIAEVTKRMVDAVKRKVTDKKLKQQLDDFSNQYTEFQNEEYLSELVGILADNYPSLSAPEKSLVKRWLQKVAKMLKIDALIDTDADVLDLLNTIGKSVKEGKKITATDVKQLDAFEGTEAVGKPVEIKSPTKKQRKQIDFKESYDMSLVSPENKINLLALIDDIVKNDQKVWFWVADQLGKGEFNGIEMDAGPSYALDPTNLAGNIIWASGMAPKTIANNVEKADYIFIISGSPTASKLFNKKVFDAFANKLGDFAAFKKEALATNPVKAIKDVLNKYDSWPALRRNQDRKVFLSAIVQQESTPNTDFHKLIKSKDGFIDLNALRDGFYRDNNFEQNDVMLVLKPTELGGKSNHSTYETNILGEVVGVPDVKLDAFEIMPESIQSKLTKQGKPLKQESKSVKAQAIAPYGTGVKKISKPKQRQQKAPIDRLAKRYDMKANGVIFAKPGIDRFALENWAKGLGYTVKITRGDRGQITSYQLMKDGRRYRPGDEKRKQRQQIVFTKSETPASIIRKARELGFNNPEIRDVLRENTDLKVSEINTMLKVPVNAFKNLPDSFINVKGGIKQGLSTFNKINEFISTLNKKNQKLENPLTQEQLATKAIEKLQSTEVYKNAADFTKVKGEMVAKKTPSTQQLAMEVAIRESFDVKPTKDAAKTLRNLKSKITERLKGMRDIQKVKRELRNFIRESLPNDQYTKSNVLKMVRFIANLTTKELTGPQLKTTMLKIQNFVTERNIANLKAKKDLLLDVSQYEKKENNLLKGKKVSADVKNRIKKIAASEPGPSMTAQEIEAQMAAWNEEANTISKKPLKTDGDLSRLSDLQIMINLSNSKLMDGSDIPSIHQVSVLDAANSALESLILEGRSELRDQLAAQRKEYVKEMQDLYNDMTGNNVDLSPKKFTVKEATAALKKDGITDPTDIQIADKIAELQDQNIQDIQKQMDQIQKDYDKNMNRLDAQKRDNILKKGFRYITEGITNFLNRAESLQGLMDIISLSPGKMLGGVAQKLVYKKINSSSIEYKGRMIMLQNKISDKMQEIYGKKWRKVARKNSEPVGTGVYRDADAVAEAQKKYDENPTKENKKKLDKEIKDQEIVMSPNEIYYQYNQFIDPANKKSYLSDKNRNFKNDPDRIMQELYDTLTDETKEWAAWQREEFFPELYDHYNEVYKKIYRTDMPWNEFYAGRIYRTDKDGMGVGDIDVLDLQGNRTQFNTAVGAASAKARIDNANPIAIMDGNDALMTYLTDMEWFAAYAENVRNISKLLGNENIKKTIEVKYGKDMNYLLKTAIDKIASRGINTAKGNKMINVFNNIFITSRLGLNPTVMLKQLTSMPTYANSIGPINYAKYAFKNKREMLKVYKEIRDNSVYMQDRNFGDMKKVIESYNQNQKVSFLPAGLKSKFDYFSDFMMVTTKVGDRAAIFLGGMPNYSYYKAEFKKAKPNATEQQAIDYAIRKFESDTKATQQSMDLQDKDYFQSGDPLARAFNMFMTTPKQYYRMERMAFRQLWRKTKAWDRKAGKGTLGENLRTVAMYHAVMPALFQYVALGLPGMMRDKTDEDDQDMLRSIILGNLNALFIVGDMLTMGFDKLRGKPWAETAPSLPALEMMAELMRLADRVERTKDPEKKAEYSNKLTTKFLELSSLPASNLYKLYKNYEKLIDGDVDDAGEAFLRAFNFSDYVIEGQMNPPTKAEMDELKKKNPQAWKVAYPAWEKLYGNKKSKKSEYDEYKKNPQAWKRRNPGKKIPNRR